MTLRAPTCCNRDTQRPAQMRPAKIIDGPSPQSALLRIHILPLCRHSTVSGFECLPVLWRKPFIFKGLGGMADYSLLC